MLDRFNIAALFRDHTRSMVKFPTNRPDFLSKLVLFGLPVTVAAVVGWTRYRVGNPTALVPATSLLAGTFFAAVGQLLSMRARIADSVQLSGNKRLRAHFRESISGLLMAALAAMFVSLLLGALALLPVPSRGDSSRVDDIVRVTAIACSAIAFALITYMALLFVASSRRLYTSYLEAFESGLPLPRPTLAARDNSKAEAASASGAPSADSTKDDPQHVGQP